MIIGVTLVAFLGLAIAVIHRGLNDEGPTMAERLEEYHTPIGNAPAPPSFNDRLALSLLSISGTDPVQRNRDLAVADVRLGVHASSTLSGAGAIGVLAFVVASIVMGVQLLLGLLIAFGVAFGVVVMSEKNLVDKAKVRREEFRASLSTFIEIAAVLIAGGAGVNSALVRASESGDNWVFLLLRARLAAASIAGVSPWVALDRLGEEMGVRQLVEFGGSMSLAAASGARITESLSAKARTARRSALTDELAAAERDSQKMSVPVALMTFASMVFIGYPAMATLFGAIA